MTEYNGSSIGLAVILGELRAESRHTATAIERQNEILLDMSTSIASLPAEIALAISSQQTSANRSNAEDRTQGILRAIPPILKALVTPLTIIGLMTGRISWTDLFQLLGAG